MKFRYWEEIRVAGFIQPKFGMKNGKDKKKKKETINSIDKSGVEKKMDINGNYTTK